MNGKWEEREPSAMLNERGGYLEPMRLYNLRLIIRKIDTNLSSKNTYQDFYHGNTLVTILTDDEAHKHYDGKSYYTKTTCNRHINIAPIDNKLLN